MLISVILLLFVIFYKCNYRFGTNFYDNYLGVNESKSMKGIFALVVVLHHLAILSVQRNYLVVVFLYVGNLAVGVFFFYSGYGLMNSLQNKDKYLNNFILKRLPNILIPFWMGNLIYLLFSIIIYKQSYNLSNLLLLLSGFTLINAHTWYIIAILIFYISFYLSFKYFETKKAILCVAFSNVIYYLICYLIGKGVFFYNSCFLFVLGIIWAYKYESITSFFRKKYYVKLSIIFVLFSIFKKFEYTFNLYTPEICVKLVSPFFGNLASIAFVVICILFMMKLKIVNSINKFLGEISLELYIIHGLFLYYFYTVDIIHNVNRYYFIFTITVSIILAYILKLLFKFLLNNYKKYKINI